MDGIFALVFVMVYNLCQRSVLRSSPWLIASDIIYLKSLRLSIFSMMPLSSRARSVGLQAVTFSKVMLCSITLI